MQRLARDYVNLLTERSAASLPNLNVVSAGTEIHGLVFMRGTREGAVDEHLGILHLGIQFDFTRVRTRVVAAIRSPVRAPIWAVKTTAVIRPAYYHEPT